MISRTPPGWVSVSSNGSTRVLVFVWTSVLKATKWTSELKLSILHPEKSSWNWPHEDCCELYRVDETFWNEIRFTLHWFVSHNLYVQSSDAMFGLLLNESFRSVHLHMLKIHKDKDTFLKFKLDLSAVLVTLFCFFLSCCHTWAAVCLCLQVKERSEVRGQSKVEREAEEKRGRQQRDEADKPTNHSFSVFPPFPPPPQSGSGVKLCINRLLLLLLSPLLSLTLSFLSRTPHPSSLLLLLYGCLEGKSPTFVRVSTPPPACWCSGTCVVSTPAATWWATVLLFHWLIYHKQEETDDCHRTVVSVFRCSVILCVCWCVNVVFRLSSCSGPPPKTNDAQVTNLHAALHRKATNRCNLGNVGFSVFRHIYLFKKTSFS